MNIEIGYWLFQKKLPHHICDDIIKYGLSQKESIAWVGEEEIQPENKEAVEKVQTQRNSNVVWLQQRWLYRYIHPFVRDANQAAGWNFQWDFTESCQFTKYKLNQFYHWHCDAFTKPYDCPAKPEHGKIRKLSAVISLSDDDEYEGGDFQFDFRNSDKGKNVRSVTEFRKKGSVIVFPSFIYHRVTPVTKGTRYSLVTWNLGYPYV